MGEDCRSLSRRRILTSGAGLTVGAGCSTFSKESAVSRVHLGYIELQNWASDQRSIEVLVERGGDIVYWSEFTLQSETQRIIISECADNLPWDGRGQYLVRARLENSTSWVTIDPVEEARHQVDYTESHRMKIQIDCIGSDLQYSIWPEQINCS